MQALTDDRGYILPPRGQRRWVIELPGGRGPDLVIDRDDEAQGVGMVLGDEDRPRRFVEALDDAVEIDERGLPLHGRAQTHVVAMMRIGAAIAIAEEAVLGEAVIVRTILALDGRGGRDREGQLGQDGGLEDPLRSDQGNSGALELEATFEDRARDGGFAEAAPMLGQEVERAQADSGVVVVRHGGGEGVEAMSAAAPSSPGVYCIRHWTLTPRRWEH